MFTLSSKSWLTAFFINFFFIWGVFLPFWGIWLTGKGVTTEQVGVLFSIGLVLRFVSSLTVLPRVSSGGAIVRLIRVLAFITLICFASLFYLNSYIWLAALTLLVNFTMAPMMPLGDIVGSRLVQQVQLDYGRVRLWGSLSFIAGSTVVGLFFVDFGLHVVLDLFLSRCFSVLLYVVVNLRIRSEGTIGTV